MCTIGAKIKTLNYRCQEKFLILGQMLIARFANQTIIMQSLQVIRVNCYDAKIRFYL